jgi:hypothetical protein
MYYECHITMEPNAFKESHIQLVVEKLGWKFSKIDGDPALGTGTRYYATANFGKQMGKRAVIAHMSQVAHHLDMGFGLKVVRAKVEVVIFDTKKGS